MIVLEHLFFTTKKYLILSQQSSRHPDPLKHVQVQPSDPNASPKDPILRHTENSGENHGEYDDTHPQRFALLLKSSVGNNPVSFQQVLGKYG
jgi:hypothetical protein